MRVVLGKIVCPEPLVVRRIDVGDGVQMRRIRTGLEGVHHPGCVIPVLVDGARARRLPLFDAPGVVVMRNGRAHMICRHVRWQELLLTVAVDRGHVSVHVVRVCLCRRRIECRDVGRGQAARGVIEKILTPYGGEIAGRIIGVRTGVPPHGRVLDSRRKVLGGGLRRPGHRDRRA